MFGIWYTTHTRVTYQSIDNLLRTNEALAQFNTTSKQLTQSQKAIARTILVLQGARNAWGDASKTINTLENQIRVFQGTIQNLKLALGDTFAEPFRKALIHINGFLIGINGVIRAFFHLKKETGNEATNPFENIAKNAKDAEHSVGLLKFDDFNVLEQGGESELAENQAITEELEHQLAIYQEQYDTVQQRMNEINNQAVQIGETIRNWFVIDTGEIDEAGNSISELTTQAKGLIGTLTILSGAGIVSGLTSALNATGKLTTAQKALQAVFSPTGIAIAGVVAILALMYTKNEDFRNSINKLITALLSLIGTILEPIIALLNSIMPLINDIVNYLAELLSPVIDIITWVIQFLDKTGLLQVAFVMIAGSLLGINGILKANPIMAIISAVLMLGTIVGIVVKKIAQNWEELWQDLKDGLRAIGNFFVNIGIGIAQTFIGIVNVLIDMLNAILSPIDAIAEKFGGKVEIPHWEADVSQYYNAIPKFAQGGIPSVGSMFIAGEAGAELVGNIGGQTNVINMEQLTQAVYNGTLSAILQANQYVGDIDTKPNVVVTLDGREIFKSVQSQAKSQGLGFSKIK